MESNQCIECGKIVRARPSKKYRSLTFDFPCCFEDIRPRNGRVSFRLSVLRFSKRTVPIYPLVLKTETIFDSLKGNFWYSTRKRDSCKVCVYGNTFESDMFVVPGATQLRLGEWSAVWKNGEVIGDRSLKAVWMTRESEMRVNYDFI